ncbi:MAG: hypothetical protein J1E83_05235 [Lachnospiraceae bacterium]|nr:hypothetical protein [Lachnospiraceae bacterium]
MPVMDEFKEERAALKNQPFKKRLSYFWTYYKWYVLGGALALIVLIYLTVEIVTDKEEALFGIVVNSSPLGEDHEFAAAFMEYAGMDPKKYEVSFNSALMLGDQMSMETVSTRELIMVYTATGDMDVAIMDTLAFETYCYTELFFDLSTILPADMFSSLEGRIYYRDNAVAKELNAAWDANESTEEIVIPDPFNPEAMKEPVPVGIDISDCTALTNAYYYSNKPVLLGLPVTSDRTDTAIKFIEFLFAEE